MATENSIGLGSLPWYKKIILVLLFPVILPVMLMAALVLLPLVGIVGAYAAVANYLSERKTRSRMIHLGRFLDLSTVCSRIQTESGTLIIEQPSLGWSFTHAWWTADDVLATSPYPMPSEEDYKRSTSTELQCNPWDRWCWENYTSPEIGRAFLLRVWNGESIEAKLIKRHPDLKVVRTWTALVHIEKFTSDTNANKIA